MRTLSKHQVRSLLNSVDLRKPFGERDYLLMLFLYHTGLRVGEVSGLLVAHVATKEKQPRQQLDLPAMLCKGSRGRIIPLNSVAQRCVSKILAAKRALGFSTAPAAPLFQNRKHGPLSVRSIQKLVKKYRLAADLDLAATPHSFRHSHASELVAAGAPLPAVQKILGHRQLLSTQVYTQPSQQQLQSASELLA